MHSVSVVWVVLSHFSSSPRICIPSTWADLTFPQWHLEKNVVNVSCGSIWWNWKIHFRMPIAKMCWLMEVVWRSFCIVELCKQLDLCWKNNGRTYQNTHIHTHTGLKPLNLYLHGFKLSITFLYKHTTFSDLDIFLNPLFKRCVR